MAEELARLIGTDALTARFLACYVGAMALLYAADGIWRAAFRRERPVPAVPARKRPPSPIQRRAKAAATGFARFIAALAITPNQITLIGLVLVAFCCATYVVTADAFVFGSTLIVAYLFDTLDGVVARAQGTSSRFGAYLDAVVDRYQEVMTYLAVGWVTGFWLASMLVVTGSMLTSYNKARAALETPVDNKAWPDFLEKPLRLFILCAALILSTLLPWLLPAALWALAAMTHFTALQRMARTHFLIRAAQAARDVRPAKA